MSDSTLNKWISEGDDAAEAAFTPDPPASPPTPEGAHLWVNKEDPVNPVLKWWDGSAFITLVDVGGAAAGGSNTEVQYNAAGSLDGITGATSDGTTLTLVAPVLGTPASGTLTNCTGLPISTGVSGLAVNVAAALATPSSANLATAITDETGTGALVFANTPTLVTPVLGTPTSGVLTNCTGLPLSTGVTGDLPFANLTQIAAVSVLGVTGGSTADVAGIAAGTDGHVLQRLSSSSLAFSNIGVTKVVRKTAADSVSLDDTVNADDELFFAIAASEVWVYDVVLFVTGNETGDFKVFMDHPTGATVRVGIDAISSAQAATATSGSIVRIQTTTETGGAGFGVSASATTTMVRLSGICVNSTNAGNITVMWAQNTSNGTNTTVEANSFIRATRVA